MTCVPLHTVLVEVSVTAPGSAVVTNRHPPCELATLVGAQAPLTVCQMRLSYTSLAPSLIDPRCGNDPRSISRCRFPLPRFTNPFSTLEVVANVGTPVEFR